MTPSVEQMKKGTCGCGRSPTGECCGWHALTEDQYQRQKALWIEEQFRKDQEDEDEANK
mgnify:CR=1 FL=1